MKLLYVLPVLAALPVSAFAKISTYNSYHIKPFVGYDLSLASSYNLKIKNDAGSVAKTDGFEFNNNNVGNFVLGVEFDDIVAVSINPSFKQTKTKVYNDTTTAKVNEINIEADIYLTRNSHFKPYITLAIGNASVKAEDVRTSGAVFSMGLGYRHYVNNNFYLNANLSYKTTTDMDVKRINGIDVRDVNARMSGLDLIVGAGYRF